MTKTPTVTFHKVYPDAISPMRADKAALGILPTMAFRHCEPVRTASAYGWYCFPPEDIILKWNGVDTFHLTDDDWMPLLPTNLPNFETYWDAHAPADMKGLAPAYLSPLPVKGMVQIWSGLLCSAAPGWSVLIRSLVNLQSSLLFQHFEGIVEADQYQPFPLFINIQLLATNTIVRIQKEVPLFQVQPLHRSTYGEEAHSYAEFSGLANDAKGAAPMSASNWAGYRKTIRLEIPGELYESGQYTSHSRKRNKHET